MHRSRAALTNVVYFEELSIVQKSKTVLQLFVFGLPELDFFFQCKLKLFLDVPFEKNMEH